MAPATRDLFRQHVETFAAKAKAALPDSNGRIDSAVKLVLAGDVELHDDGSATVGSGSDASQRYTVNGRCDCQDFPRAPEGYCKHRIAAGIEKRAVAATRQALDTQEASRIAQVESSAAQAPTPTPADEDPAWNALAPSRDAIAPPAPRTAGETRGESATIEASGSPDATSSILSGFSGGRTPPLPEAPASVNCHITMAGRQVQLTLRDTDEDRLLARLAQVLQRFPVEAPALVQTPTTPQPPICQWHGRMKESTKAKGTWYCPGKKADGTYCQERWPAKGR